MTTHFATGLMSAGNTQKFNPNKDREEVNTVAIFESRQAAEKRASDQSVQIDRAVLLESMRQIRKAQSRKASIESGLYFLRNSR